MKLTIAQKELAAAAKAAARQVPSRPLPPILAGVVLEAADGQLSVSGFDFEASATVTVAADVEEPGRIVVPGQLFAEIVGSLPAGDVTVDLDGSEALIVCGDARFALLLMPVHDYPQLPQMPTASGAVPGDLFADAVSHAAGVTMDPKEATGSMAGLAGINLSVEDGELLVQATDRYTIAEHRLPWEGADVGAVTVPPRVLVEAARAAAGGDVRLSLDGTLFGLTGGGLQAVARVLADSFPMIAKVWPAEPAATLDVDADALRAAVRRIALVTEDTDPLLFEATADSLWIQAAKNGAAASGRQRLDAVLEGAESFRIAFQPRRLTAALAPLSGAMQIGLSGPLKPAVFTSATSDSYRALVMAVKRDWVLQQPEPARAAA